MRSIVLHWNRFIFSFLFTLILLSSFASAENDISSKYESKLEPLSLELVHRHDPRIPGNEDLKLDKYEAIKDRVLMDLQRRGLSMMQMPTRSGMDFSMSEYYVQLRVGTPPQKHWMIADTGSDLTWLVCIDEFEKQPADTRRGFFRKMSKTYKPLGCGDPICQSDEMVDMGAQECRNHNDNCTYSYMYAHGTYVSGELGTDVVTLGLTDSGNKGTIDDMLIGCTREIEFGSDNEGEDFMKSTDGILGLGYTPTSFLYKATKQYGNKFSYCLMDRELHMNSTNFLTFGSYETNQTQKATLSAPTKRTKLIITPGGDYGVQLEGISLGGQMLQLPAELWDFKTGGGLTLDSGTSLTSLSTVAFEMIGQGMMKALAPKYKTIVDQNNTSAFKYCFVAGARDDFEKDVPKLAIHFVDGVMFEPPVKNYVLPVDPDIHCIGLIETSKGSHKAGLIGNIMQQFHLWEFDLASMTLGFAPSQCTF